MFRVTLRKNLFSGDSQETSKQHARAWYEMEMPFPPVVGLQVHFGNGADANIENVSWHSNEQAFAVFCGHKFMDTDNPDYDFHNFEHWVEAEADVGWQVGNIVERTAKRK